MNPVFSGIRSLPRHWWLDTVPAPDAEHKEMLGERVQAETILDQHRQAVDTFAMVNGIRAQIDHRQTIRRSHHGKAATVRKTVGNLRAFASALNSTNTPLGNWILPLNTRSAIDDGGLLKPVWRGLGHRLDCNKKGPLEGPLLVVARVLQAAACCFFREKKPSPTRPNPSSDSAPGAGTVSLVPSKSL